MAKQTFTTGQVLTAAQMTSLQQTAMLGGAASAKVASYVLVAADAGNAITMSNAGATTITVNTGLFAAGDILTIINLGAGVCTITAGTATVSTSGSLALAQNQGGVLRFTSASAAIFFQFATPASGDIEGVTAGTGISGGGTSGTVTITNSMATEITAKGDLIVGTGNATFDNLPVGANGTTIVADSTASTGLAWAAVSAGGMTAIASGSLSGTSVTLSSISGTYKNLQLVLRDFTFSSGSGNNVKITANSITSYSIQQVATGSNGAALQTGYDQAVAQMYLFYNSLVQTPTASSSIIGIYSYAGTTAYKMISAISQGDRGSGLQGVMNYTGVVNSTAAITSITIGTNGANFSSGTYILYGVS